MKREQYEEKFREIISGIDFAKLPDDQQDFIEARALEQMFTFQELRIITDIAHDLNSWDGSSIVEIWPDVDPGGSGRDPMKDIVRQIEKTWNDLKALPNIYDDFETGGDLKQKEVVALSVHREAPGFGKCPVASEKTRCCNLLTLDAVESCGHDCSYCSIQSFYNDHQVSFDSGFRDKLRSIELDPDMVYHIGTGQSSDSLMWSNREGILDALVEFAAANPNAIIEMKTKSANIDYFLENQIPPNIICTWSLNTDTIISNEEHLTASLNERINAARKVADNGVLVGFHFHPMVHYRGYLDEYDQVCRKVIEIFNPGEVAMVSFGTLTFTKSVIRQIRRRGLKSKVLKMEMEETGGKFSYPEEIKIEMFRHGWYCFEPWHGDVFFYMCMEPQSLWKPVFGYEYQSNCEFENAMKTAYMDKVSRA